MNRKEREAALEAARREIEQRVREQLPAPKTDVEIFMRAAGDGDSARVKALLATGMPVDVVDDKECTAMNYASGDVAMIRVLLAAGANPNGPEPEPGGLTPLVQAATHGHLDSVRVLLEAGADPNFRSYFPLRQKRLGCKTRTAIDHARSNRHKKVVELLLRAGARPSPAEFAFEAVKAFAETAAQPAYAEVLNRLASLCGQAPPAMEKGQGRLRFFLE